MHQAGRKLLFFLTERGPGSKINTDIPAFRASVRFVKYGKVWQCTTNDMFIQDKEDCYGKNDQQKGFS